MPKSKKKASGQDPNKVWENLNIYDVLNYSKKDVEKYIQDLRAQNTKEHNELADTLEALPDDFYEPTKAQKKLRRLLELFEKQGVAAKQMAIVIQSLLATVTNIMTIKVNETMSEKVQAYWDQYMSYGPNMLQQLSMLDYIYKASTKKSLDDLFENTMIQVIDQTENVMAQSLSLTQKINALPEKTVEQVNTYFDNGQYHEGFELIYNASGK